jgi:hypothetical protein
MKNRTPRSVTMPPKRTPTACPHADKAAWARGMCKACYDKWLKNHNPKYAESQKQNTERWKSQNYDRIKASARARSIKQTPEYRRARLLANYGMTIDDYNSLLARQGGGCAVCHKPPSKRSLHVDHCHETGVVRGLLCFRCNYGMSYFSEQPERLRQAADYLDGLR